MESHLWRKSFSIEKIGFFFKIFLLKKVQKKKQKNWAYHYHFVYKQILGIRKKNPRKTLTTCRWHWIRSYSWIKLKDNINQLEDFLRVFTLFKIYSLNCLDKYLMTYSKIISWNISFFFGIFMSCPPPFIFIFISSS